MSPSISPDIRYVVPIILNATVPTSIICSEGWKTERSCSGKKKNVIKQTAFHANSIFSEVTSVLWNLTPFLLP